MSRELVERLLNQIRSSTDRQREEQKRRLQELKKEEKSIRRRRDIAYEDKLDARISEERWLELELNWSAKSRTLKDRISQFKKELKPREDEAREAFELLGEASELYQRQSDEERARLLRSLLSNCIITSENVVSIYKEPYSSVAALLPHVRMYSKLMLSRALCFDKEISSNRSCSRLTSRFRYAGLRVA